MVAASSSIQEDIRSIVFRSMLSRLLEPTQRAGCYALSLSELGSMRISNMLLFSGR
jgi:hypothetical protein